MRTLVVLIICLATFGLRAQEKSIKTETFTVKGNCEDCKERIENAADIKGVKVLNWNSDSKVASVTYDTAKVSLEKIQLAIAASGHDAGAVKSTDKAYSKLPKCCKYRDGKCEETKK